MSSSSRPTTSVAAQALTTFILFLLSSPAEARRVPPGTPPLCKPSDYPAICSKIARSVHTLTPETLTEASVNAATSKAKQARAAAARLTYSMRNHTTQQYLSMCRGAYTDALSSLRAAAASLKTSSKNRNSIMADLSAAMNSVKSCEKRFREVPGMAFPLRRINNSLTRMVRNSLTLSSNSIFSVRDSFL